jgi:glycosyltransferase involved in cell wall biosynthesis
MITLSACLMVKNEAANLPRCLGALRALGVIDEIVVVDTGSTDETIEIARSFGARVVVPEDIDALYIETEFGRAINFSAARNITIREARGAWLYLLDADEETVGEAGDLKAWLARLREDQDAVAITFEDYKGGKKFMQFVPPRIFRKTDRLRFENIVHNRAVGYHEPAIFYPGIRIKHTGFDLNPEQKEAKRRRTLGLLKKQLEMDPKSYWALFYMAGIYGDQQDYPATIKTAIEYIEHKDEVERFNPSVYYLLCQACLFAKDGEAADKWIGQAIRELPDDMDVAAAVCDFGAWRKAPHILATGCELYLKSWAEIEANPIGLGSRFIYNYNNETLARVLFHLSHIRLSQGTYLLSRLKETLTKVDPEFAAAVERDIVREHGAIGVKWIADGIEVARNEKAKSPKVVDLRKAKRKKNKKQRRLAGGRI